MDEPSPHAQLDRMITGYWLSQAIYAAAKFGIADLLKSGPRSVDDLAEQTSTNPDALYRRTRHAPHPRRKRTHRGRIPRALRSSWLRAFEDRAHRLGSQRH